MPSKVYDGVCSLSKWLRDKDTEKHVSRETREALERELAVISEIPRIVPTRNPYVMLKYDDDFLKERHLVTLADYVYVSLCKPTFEFPRGANKKWNVKYDAFKAAFATPRQIEKYLEKNDPFDNIHWSIMGDYTPNHGYDAFEALIDLFFQEDVPVYDTECDMLPDPESFRTRIEECLAKFPMSVAFEWHDKKLSIEFNDARLAALFLESPLPPIIERLPYPRVWFEDSPPYTIDAESVWTLDSSQWDKMQEACSYRDSWEDMCAAAKRIVRQKRLKF